MAGPLVSDGKDVTMPFRPGEAGDLPVQPSLVTRPGAPGSEARVRGVGPRVA